MCIWTVSYSATPCYLLIQLANLIDTISNRWRTKKAFNPKQILTPSKTKSSQKSLLRWTQFWVRETFSKPASLLSLVPVLILVKSDSRLGKAWPRPRLGRQTYWQKDKCESLQPKVWSQEPTPATLHASSPLLYATTTKQDVSSCSCTVTYLLFDSCLPHTLKAEIGSRNSIPGPNNSWFAISTQVSMDLSVKWWPVTCQTLTTHSTNKRTSSKLLHRTCFHRAIDWQQTHGCGVQSTPHFGLVFRVQLSAADDFFMARITGRATGANVS